MYVHSARLGISGQCDAVEFLRAADGVTIAGWEGRWQPYPVEYKRGRPQAIDADRLQLCAQAMALEEMLACGSARNSTTSQSPLSRRRWLTTFIPRVMSRSPRRSVCAVSWQRVCSSRPSAVRRFSDHCCSR